MTRDIRYCVIAVTDEQIQCVFPRKQGGHGAVEEWMDGMMGYIERGVYQENLLTKRKLKTSIFLKPNTTVYEALLDVMNAIVENGWVVGAVVGDSTEKVVIGTAPAFAEGSPAAPICARL